MLELSVGWPEMRKGNALRKWLVAMAVCGCALVGCGDSEQFDPLAYCEDQGISSVKRCNAEIENLREDAEIVREQQRDAYD
jgi:hypothetical protein